MAGKSRKIMGRLAAGSKEESPSDTNPEISKYRLRGIVQKVDFRS